MKITIDEKPAAPKIEYPCLMTAGEGKIVFFFTYGSGTVIKHPGWAAGQYSADWRMDNFTPFTGSVTLSND